MKKIKVDEEWTVTVTDEIRFQEFIEMETVTVIGLEWDKEDIDGDHTFEQANVVAHALGRRLPTKEEFEKLSKLPHVWDYERNGMWFAEDENDLKNPDKSLFFSVYNNNTFKRGYYWSRTAGSEYWGYVLNFFHDGVYPENEIMRHKPVYARCVRL
jgi:hypothetical protein